MTTDNATVATSDKPRASRTSLRAYVMIGVLGLIWLYFHWATGYVFLTPRNLSNLMTQMTVTGIIAVGMLMVIVSGNIDLSVGSVLGFAGGIAAFGMASMGFGLATAIIAAISVAVAVSVFQGALTAYLNIPAFIVTLGGLLAWRGAVKWLLAGNTVPVSDETFKYIGQGNLPAWIGWAIAASAVIFVIIGAVRKTRSVKEYGLGEANYAGALLRSIIPVAAILAFIGVMNAWQGVPFPVLLLLAAALLGAFLTNSTVFGRYLYAIGGNADAARLSGINNKRNIVKVYALLGALTGVASLIFTARVGSAAPDAGVLKELDAIAACVIGGASLMGGRGTIFGACLGALIMASLDNGMSLLNVRDFMQDIIKGSILVAAVGLDMAGRRET
ncbi:MAG: sugar ABC transporter permease [Acidobacteria bacterium]|nr:sugar ABC transporter permease [Acidobacteriota bacterium]